MSLKSVPLALAVDSAARRQGSLQDQLNDGFDADNTLICSFFASAIKNFLNSAVAKIVMRSVFAAMRVCRNMIMVTASDARPLGIAQAAATDAA